MKHLKRYDEGFLDLFRKKYSDDDKIILDFMKRLERIKDVSPYEIVGGVPAKHIRYRFDEGKISFLLKTKWWDFEESVLRNYVEKFQDLESFQEFITKP